jgi:hypothetical protein
MKAAVSLCFLICCVYPIAAQNTPSTATAFLNSETSGTVQPQISQLILTPDTVSELHLRPNFATSILMPEPVTDVVLGAPALFSQEHSEHSPELVVVKPITSHPATTNLQISTRSGQSVSLRLISDGDASGPVDFVLRYKRPRDFLILSDDPADAIGPEEQGKKPISLFDAAFDEQTHVTTPEWTAHHNATQELKIGASVGSVSADGEDMIVAFSVLNRSGQWIEVLPPQIELNNPDLAPNQQKNKKHRNVLANQVPIKEYRYSGRKLAPGARADGVVRFERPNYKQAQEHLQLELATADAADYPLLINLPFTAPGNSNERISPNAKEESHGDQ